MADEWDHLHEYFGRQVAIPPHPMTIGFRVRERHMDALDRILPDGALCMRRDQNGYRAFVIAQRDALPLIRQLRSTGIAQGPIHALDRYEGAIPVLPYMRARLRASRAGFPAKSCA